MLNLAQPFQLIKYKQYAVLIHGTPPSWNGSNTEGSSTVVDTISNLEQLLLAVPVREFELPFKKICVSWMRSIRKHTSKEIITADLLVREIY